MVYNYGPFPYATFDTGEHRDVFGQMIVMDTADPAFITMNRVECRAGYTPLIVTVTFFDNTIATAVAYGADAHTVANLLPRLPIVQGGDWNSLLTL